MNNPFLEAAIESHIEKYKDGSHENDCALCIAYSLGLRDSKPFQISLDIRMGRRRVEHRALERRGNQTKKHTAHPSASEIVVRRQGVLSASETKCMSLSASFQSPVPSVVITKYPRDAREWERWRTMKQKKKKLSKNEAELRLYGYMTVEEFVKAYSIGLRLQLEEIWSNNRDGLHHPEDLAANSLSFAEAVFNTISIFGVNGSKVFMDGDYED